jgi:hypothetical protein
MVPMIRAMMPPMTRLRWATVTAVEGQRPGALELGVLVDGEGGAASAVAYPQLVGPVTTGDRVLLNTTAVALGLGTGGWHSSYGSTTPTVTADRRGAARATS